MRFAGCALAILAVAAPLAFAGPDANRPAHISWADKQHRYGWALSTARTKGGWCPSRYVAPRVCSTEDGGKHWHGILYGNFDHALAVVRSGQRKGLVYLTHANQTYPLLTLNNGGDWYLNSRMYGAGRIWVKKGRVFWTSHENVYRLSGWPSPGVRATCSVPGLTTGWVYGVHAVGPRRNVCWAPDYKQPAGIVRGVSKTLISTPDQSKISWADSRHAFASDPAGARWRCAPKGARDYVVTLCATNNAGKSWWISYSQEWKTFGSLLAIFDVWRGPAKDGAFELAFSSDGYGADTVFVTHDGGGNWEESEAFFDGMKHGCDGEEPAGTLCAGGITFHQVHTEPQQLVYDLIVCPTPFTQCETRTYRMDGWPNGNLTPVRLSP